MYVYMSWSTQKNFGPTQIENPSTATEGYTVSWEDNGYSVLGSSQGSSRGFPPKWPQYQCTDVLCDIEAAQARNSPETSRSKC